MEEIEKDYDLVLGFIDYVLCTDMEKLLVKEALDRLKEKAELYDKISY